MLIGGLQKNSFIDYPGKTSCVVFLSGCNFHCPYCHNVRLVTEQDRLRSVEPKYLYDFLEKRKGLLEGVVISGGEPTLHQDLFLLCEKIKKIGYPIKLDTNGSRPKALKDLIDRDLVDYIAMDIKTDPDHYPSNIYENCAPDSILASIQIIMKSSKPYEFRTTCVKPLVNTKTVRRIGRIIQDAMRYALQRFHNTEVLNPDFFLKTGSGCGDEEIIRFRSLAEPWVQECIIR